MPDLNNAEKLAVNAALMNDLIDRGLSKQTAPNFYIALEVLNRLNWL